MSHPLDQVLIQYIDDFEDMKDNNADLDNISFNRQFGLQVNPPVCWPFAESLSHVFAHAAKKGFNNFVVVYSTTEVYMQVVKSINSVQQEQKVSYFSWHEIYSAASRASEDMTYIRRLKKLLMEAEIVFFLGASTALNQVVDQVKASSTGCLIMLG